MLVISVGQSIKIGDGVLLTVADLDGGKCILRILAPRHTQIELPKCIICDRPTDGGKLCDTCRKAHYRGG